MNLKQMVENTVKVLNKAKIEYYEGTSIMSDAEFDELEEKLRDLDPSNEYFKQVGVSNTNYGNKITHLFPMLSTQKAKTVADVNQWYDKISNGKEICITPKYDGLSFTAKYNGGKIQYLSTRGNGRQGQDISDKIKYIEDIKENILYQNEVEIRGELILSKQHVEFFKDKSLRNICSGMINRKDNYKNIDKISAIAYNIIGKDFYNEEGKYKFLKENNWRSSSYLIIKDINEIEDIYNEWVSSKRKEFEYELDGLVLTFNDIQIQKKNKGRMEHHFDYQIAFKFPSESKKTILEDISWQISRFGNLIPIANFKEIILQNRKITNASISNYKNVIDLKLEKGDEVLISLSNDVIPYLEENITKGIKQR